MLLENNPYPADVRVRNEAEALVRAGFSVTVIAPRGPGQPRREVIDGVRAVRFRMPQGTEGVRGFLLEYLVANLQLYLRGVWELARGARILHLHNPPDTLAGVALVARVLGRRVVFDQHDLFPELVAARFGRGPGEWFVRACERATFRVADVVLAPNDSHRGIALGRGGKDAATVTVVRNGPRRATLIDSPVHRTGKLDDPQLVFLGAMGPQDGVDTLPDLMRRLSDEHDLPGSRLTLIGDGSRRSHVEAAFAEQGMSARVKFTGQVEHSEIPGLLAEADICVDPAPCSELNHRSTMIKVAEYLAAARPVVAYRLLETERTAGPAALYAGCGREDEFAALVGRLASDGELRASLGQQGRRRAEALVWEVSEAALLAAYDAL
jgi:glycosyltransferase involved in cell wall biosynthesis